LHAGRPSKDTGVKKHARNTVVGLLKYGVGFGLLAYILIKYWEPQGNSPGIKGLLEQTPDFLLFAAVGACGVAVVSIQFVRWYFLVRALDLPFTMGNAFRLGLVGGFYNAFLPGSVGGDLVKAYFIAKDSPGRRAAAVATVLADRLIGLFGLLWFSAVIGGAFWLAGDERVTGNEYLKFIIRVCGGAVVLTALGWVVMGFLPERRADRFKGRLNGIPKVGHTLGEMWFAVWTYRQRPKVIYALIGVTAVCHVVMVFMFHLAVRVFAASDPGTVAEHFVIAPIGFIAQAFFPAPGGVGGAEAIFGYLYTLLNRPETTGVVGRLTLRVVEWGLGLIGLAVFLRMRDVLPAVEDEAAEEGYGGHEEPTPEAPKAV
jgi:uncharacterized protein (TIRG00374 family)